MISEIKDKNFMVEKDGGQLQVELLFSAKTEQELIFRVSKNENY